MTISHSITLNIVILFHGYRIVRTRLIRGQGEFHGAC